jgi:hypothetical protein
MSFITAFFYDRFMAKAEEACLKEWRYGLLQQVSGEVLEVGAGTGANITSNESTICIWKMWVWPAEQPSRSRPIMNHSTMLFHHSFVAR